LPVFVFLATLTSSPQVPSSTTEVRPPDLNVIRPTHPKILARN
jgi:hypothetical protein